MDPVTGTVLATAGMSLIGGLLGRKKPKTQWMEQRIQLPSGAYVTMRKPIGQYTPTTASNILGQALQQGAQSFAMYQGMGGGKGVEGIEAPKSLSYSNPQSSGMLNLGVEGAPQEWYQPRGMIGAGRY